MITAEICLDGTWTADGVMLTGDAQNGYVAHYVNKCGKAVHTAGFRFTGIDFPAKSGEDIRVFRESWTAVSPTCSRRFGEKECNLDKDYKKYCVSKPVEYDSTIPNRIYGEYVAVLNNRAAGTNRLVGFVTSNAHYTQVLVVLNQSGVQEITAFSDADGILLDSGAAIDSEALIIRDGNDAWTLLEGFADSWGKNMKAPLWDHTVTGWCSWYYYFNKITSADVRENLDYVSKNRKEWPLEYFQIDDGYQKFDGDWLDCSEQFPEGIEEVCRTIAKADIKPGLWFAPMLVNRGSKLCQERPDILIHDKNGEIFYMPWHSGTKETAVLDCSNPAALEWLTQMFRKIREAGCVYIKLDFMMVESCIPAGLYQDPHCTRLTALKQGLLAIRKGIGDDAFILGGTMILGAAVGIVNGQRIGGDITPYWELPEQKCNPESPRVPNAMRNILNRGYMHRRIWINDPDVFMVRKDNTQLTEAEMLLWQTGLWLGGGAQLLSDRFSTLDPERAELAKLLLARKDQFDTRPLDLFEREYPALWLARNREDGAPTLGVFNFEDAEQTFDIDLAAIFGNGSQVKDFWSPRIITALKQNAIRVPAHSCLLLMDMKDIPAA